jgi:hypothetical protein
MTSAGAVLVLDDGGDGSDGYDRTLADIVAPTDTSVVDSGADVLASASVARSDEHAPRRPCSP